MKTLLEKIKTTLIKKLPYQKKVEIIVDNSIPDDISIPFIGIKDGDTDYIHHPGNRDEILDVIIIVFLKIYGDIEESLIGNKQTKGIIEIVQDIEDILDKNTFDYDSKFYAANVIQIGASENIEEERRQYKGMIIQYKRNTMK